MNRKPSLLFCIALSLLYWVANSAWAGPPLLCHPFQVQGQPSLPWGSGWNRPSAEFDLRQLGARTQALLSADTPVIARMETLRRAAIYASADAQALSELSQRLEARVVAAATAQARALALFDAGYFDETLEDVVRLQGYDMPGIGRVDAAALRRVAARQDGAARIDQALAIRPDPAMHFAAALVAGAHQRVDAQQRHARLARVGASGDTLLLRNLTQIASL